MQTQLPDGRTVEIVTDYVDVAWMPGMKIDPDWIGVDINGHEHRAADLLATVQWVDTSYTVEEEDGYLEEYSAGYWGCTICGVEVTPGTKHVPGGRRQMPGLRTMYVDGVPVMPAEAEAIMAEMRG